MELAGPDADNLIEELLTAGNSVRVKVTGRSMAPFLRGGEILTIQPAAGRRLRIGDIVLFRSSQGRHVIHRVVRVDRAAGMILTKGDALNACDETIDRHSVLGVAGKMERDRRGGNGNIVDLESSGQRLTARFIAWKGKIRSALRGAYGESKALLSGRGSPDSRNRT
jgi:signal peptidase I